MKRIALALAVVLSTAVLMSDVQAQCGTQRVSLFNRRFRSSCTSGSCATASVVATAPQVLPPLNLPSQLSATVTSPALSMVTVPQATAVVTAPQAVVSGCTSCQQSAAVQVAPQSSCTDGKCSKKAEVKVDTESVLEFVAPPAIAEARVAVTAPTAVVAQPLVTVAPMVTSQIVAAPVMAPVWSSQSLIASAYTSPAAIAYNTGWAFGRRAPVREALAVKRDARNFNRLQRSLYRAQPTAAAIVY